MGCAVIWSALFAMGSFLYGRMLQGGLLTAMFVASGLLLLFVINRLWDRPDESLTALPVDAEESSITGKAKN